MTFALREMGVRLRNARINAKATQPEVARTVGKSKQLVSAWEAGRSEITLTSLVRFAKSYSADLNWLLLGNSSGGENGRTTYASGAKLPLIDLAQDLRKVTTITQVQRLRNTTSRPALLPSNCIAAINRDDAMAPEFRKGDFLFADNTAPVEPGRLVVAIVRAIDGTELQCPMLVLREIQLASTTDSAPPFQLMPSASGYAGIRINTPGDVLLLGPLVGVLRGPSG